MANTLKLGAGKWATGTDTVLAFNDENNNFKPLPFDFSRASSATVVNQSGLIETVGSGTPRIDFKDNTKGALLLEPQRTNLYTYSNDVSFWSGNDVVTTNNYAISPDGTQNAFRVAFSSSTGSLYINALGTTGVNNTLSVWAKSNNGSSNKFRFFGNGFLTLSNDYIATEEWQRFEFTYSCTNVTSGLAGASDSATNDILFYGFQHEVGSYATSYIPTSGSAVTRVAESCYQGGLLDKGVLNNTALTLFFNSTLTSDTTNQYLEVINLYNLSNGNKIRLETRTNNIIHVQQSGVVNSGDNFNSASLGSNSINFKKIAIVLTQTQFKIFANGNQINTTYNGSYNVNLNSLGFRGDNNSVETKIQNKEIKLYNTALTDQELIALTTI